MVGWEISASMGPRDSSASWSHQSLESSSQYSIQ